MIRLRNNQYTNINIVFKLVSRKILQTLSRFTVSKLSKNLTNIGQGDIIQWFRYKPFF